MPLKILGYEVPLFRKASDVELNKQQDAIEVTKDGSYVITTGAVNRDVSQDVISSVEVDLIDSYRRISLFPEVHTAIDEIVNEVVVIEDDQDTVSINLDDLEEAKIVSSNILDKIREEFDEVISLLNFNDKAYDIVREWYVDGRIAFYKNFNSKNVSGGISSLTQLDPRKLRKVKIIDDNEETYNVKEEFYVYFRNIPKGLTSGTTIQVTSNNYNDVYQKDVVFRVNPELITYIDSGLIDRSSNIIYGYLHKAIRVANQLDLAESSILVSRINHAKERRVIYIDTSRLPPAKSRERLESVRREFRSKVGYDTVRGTLSSTNRVMSLEEDYFLARHGGNRTTEITPLQSPNTSQGIEDIQMWKEKLYSALDVPKGRFRDGTNLFSQDTQISMEEMKFHKFVTRLRSKFSKLFFDILRTQLITKRILTVREFDEILPYLKIKYNKDNFWSELKELEIMNLRFAAAEEAQKFAGIYYSHETIRSKFMGQNLDEREEEDRKIEEEQKDERFKRQTEPSY